MDLTILNEISDEVQKYDARLLPVIKGRKTEEILKVYAKTVVDEFPL